MSTRGVASAYLVETTLLEIVTSISLILALLLVASATPRFAQQPVATTKRFFHAIVTICCILSVVKSIDNQQVFNRYHNSHYIAIFLTNNITPCLMTAGSVLIYTTIDVQYKISKSPTPPTLRYLLVGLACLNFVAINSCTIAAVVMLKQLYYIYVLVYMIVSFILLLVIADVSVYMVRKIVMKFQDATRSQRTNNKVAAAEKSLYPLYAFVAFLNVLLIIVIAALLYQAVSISVSGDASKAPNRADPQAWSLDIFAWVQTLAIYVFIWWSWVPLSVIHPLARRLGYVPEDKHVTMATDGTIPNRHGSAVELTAAGGGTTARGSTGTARGWGAVASAARSTLRLSPGLNPQDSARGMRASPGMGADSLDSSRRDLRASGSQQGRLFQGTMARSPDVHGLSRPTLLTAPNTPAPGTTTMTYQHSHQHSNPPPISLGASVASPASLTDASLATSTDGLITRPLPPSRPVSGGGAALRFQGRDDLAELSVSREGRTALASSNANDGLDLGHGLGDDDLPGTTASPPPASISGVSSSSASSGTSLIRATIGSTSTPPPTGPSSSSAPGPGHARGATLLMAQAGSSSGLRLGTPSGAGRPPVAPPAPGSRHTSPRGTVRTTAIPTPARYAFN